MRLLLVSAMHSLLGNHGRLACNVSVPSLGGKLGAHLLWSQSSSLCEAVQHGFIVQVGTQVRAAALSFGVTRQRGKLG